MNTTPSVTSAGSNVDSARSRSTHQEVLGELRTPGQHPAVGADDHRVAVEDQLVLAADHVEVGQGAPGLCRATAHQLEAGVVLVPLVRRTVDAPAAARRRPRAAIDDRPALLPDVLADGQGHVDATDADHGQVVPGREYAVLVEDAVVGQVVLRVARDDAAAVQDGGAVLGQLPARVGVDGTGRRAVEVADDHRQVAEPVGVEVCGEPGQRRPGRVDERRAQREVLDRVAGQRHLGEGHQVGAGLRGLGGPRRPCSALPARSPTVALTWARASRSCAMTAPYPRRRGLRRGRCRARVRCSSRPFDSF